MGQQRTTTLEAWLAEGHELFGDDIMTWRFVCPACRHIQSPADLLPHLPEDPQRDTKRRAAELSYGICIGRLKGAKRQAFGGSCEAQGPCDYTSGGLFNINPVLVQTDEGVIAAFEFDRTGGKP